MKWQLLELLQLRSNYSNISYTVPLFQSARPGDPGSEEAAEFDFCGCGWPHHMLIAKGNQQGYPVVLFAMVSNWAEDRVRIQYTWLIMLEASISWISGEVIVLFQELQFLRG